MKTSDSDILETLQSLSPSDRAELLEFLGVGEKSPAEMARLSDAINLSVDLNSHRRKTNSNQ